MIVSLTSSFACFNSVGRNHHPVAEKKEKKERHFKTDRGHCSSLSSLAVQCVQYDKSSNKQTKVVFVDLYVSVRNKLVNESQTFYSQNNFFDKKLS